MKSSFIERSRTGKLIDGGRDQNTVTSAVMDTDWKGTKGLSLVNKYFIFWSCNVYWDYTVKNSSSYIMKNSPLYTLLYMYVVPHLKNKRKGAPGWLSLLGTDFASI